MSDQGQNLDSREHDHNQQLEQWAGYTQLASMAFLGYPMSSNPHAIRSTAPPDLDRVAACH